jgi:hypothetical protein
VCYTWDGVGCDGADGHVTAMRLPRWGLTGALPSAALAGLTRCEELDISHNALFGDLASLSARSRGLPERLGWK